MTILTSIKNYFYNKLIRPMIASKDSPHLVALGAAIGMWIAMTPTVGVQMTMVVIVAFIPGLQFNVPVAIAMVWLSNPITMWFLYYSFYVTGLFLMDKTGDSWIQFQEKVSLIITQIENLPPLEKMYEGFHGFFLIGLDYVIPMWLGSALIATVLAIPTYPFTLWLLKIHRNHSKKKISEHNQTEPESNIAEN